jgi:hypothetical protein
MYSIQNITRKYSFPHVAVIFPTCSSNFYKEKHTFGTIFRKNIHFSVTKRKVVRYLSEEHAEDEQELLDNSLPEVAAEVAIRYPAFR